MWRESLIFRAVLIRRRKIWRIFRSWWYCSLKSIFGKKKKYLKRHITAKTWPLYFIYLFCFVFQFVQLCGKWCTLHASIDFNEMCLNEEELKPTNERPNTQRQTISDTPISEGHVRIKLETSDTCFWTVWKTDMWLKYRGSSEEVKIFPIRQHLVPWTGWGEQHVNINSWSETRRETNESLVNGAIEIWHGGRQETWERASRCEEKVTTSIRPYDQQGTRSHFNCLSFRVFTAFISVFLD